MLAFGLSCASRIMTSILHKVLSYDDRIRHETDHCINDIVVQESVVGVGEVCAHLTSCASIVVECSRVLVAVYR